MRKHLLLLLSALYFISVSASNLTPGNIVVVRMGDGSAALSNAATATFLDEYTPAGVLVQSIAAPTAVSGSNHILTNSGTATSEGSLSLSANGSYLSLAGYDAATGTAGVATSASNRIIGRVDATGAFNTSTGYTAGTAYVTNNIRSAVTDDGTGFWTAGTGSTGTGGIWYVPFGGIVGSGVQTSTTVTNTRVVNIFGGQLYFATGSGATGIYADGTGLPTTTGQTETLLPGLPTLDTLHSPYAFLMLDESSSVSGVDVLYAIDDDTSAARGGVHKYSLVGGQWVSNGHVTNAVALRGLTGFHVCSGSQLYASGPAGVYSFFDASGYNQSITGSFTQIVTATTNTAIRGIAFAPGTVSPTAPQVSIASHSDVSCFGQSNGSIQTTVTGGVPTISYQWTGGANTPNVSNLAAGAYTVTVTDHYGCSSTASVTISSPPVLSATISSTTGTSCASGADGSINASAAGGTTPYSYQWTNTSQTTPTITGLTAGAYSLTVSDSAGCTAVATANVSQPAPLALTLTPVGVTTHGASDGGVNLNVTGGTTTYSYVWNNASTAMNLTGVPAGQYCVTVTDQHGCIDTGCTTVSQPTGVNGISWANSFDVHMAAGELNVSLICDAQMQIQATLYDLSGQSVYSSAIQTSDRLELHIPCDGYAKGCYLLRIMTDKGALTRKVLMQ